MSIEHTIGQPSTGITRIPGLPVIPIAIDDVLAEVGAPSTTSYESMPAEAIESSPYEQYAPVPGVDAGSTGSTEQAAATGPVEWTPELEAEFTRYLTDAGLSAEEARGLIDGPDGIAAQSQAATPVPAPWTPQIEAAFTKVFEKAGIRPEVADALINGPEGIKSSQLTIMDVAFAMQYYSSSSGVEELQGIQRDIDANMPTKLDIAKALAPYAAVGVGVAGAGAYAYNRGRHSLANRTETLARDYANGSSSAEARVARGGAFDPAGRRVAAMMDPEHTGMQARAQAGLQLMDERAAGASYRGTPGVVSPHVTKLLNGGVVSDDLLALARKSGITDVIPGETSYSLANRIAQKNGVGITETAAKAFVDGRKATPFNSGGSYAFRPYDLAPGVDVKPGYAGLRAATDNMGVGVLHPVERFRLATQAFALGPERTAIEAARANGAGYLQRTGAGIAAGIKARTIPTSPAAIAGGAAVKPATIANGLKGIGVNSLKSMTGKAGIAGVALGAAFEVPQIYNTVKEHGIDSKEAGNAIGGGTGRVVGGLAGFAAGTAVAGVVTSSAIAGATLGSAVPVVGTLIGLAVGAGVGYLASNGLGKVGEHAGDALSATGKAIDVADAKIDDAADKTKDVIHNAVPIIPKGAVNVAVEGAKHIVTAPVQAVKAAKDGVGALVNGIKGLFD